MLRKLLVNNYALIDELNIDFTSGLSIITGETGSGKSILLGAMALILGQRADTSVLQDKSRKCIVEGEFGISGYGLEDFFNENELDFDTNSIIRREISESGKSRAFINDTPVNLNLLKELGSQLVDIHSQHHNLILSENRFQLDVIDVIAGNSLKLQEYHSRYREFIQAREYFENLKEMSEKAGADLDYLEFQLNQLTDARLVEGEQARLEEELEKLTHAGEIKETLIQSYTAFNADDMSLLISLKEILQGMGRIKPFFPEIAELHRRMESSLIELKDISDEIGILESTTDFDPGRADFINERLDLLYSLQQKHQVTTVEELIGIRETLRGKTDEISGYEFSIEEAGKKVEEYRHTLNLLAKELSGNRIKAIPVLEQHMVKLLILLGIPNARFEVSHQKLSGLSRDGLDKVVFMFSANRQSPPMELSKVASGGEMSRVMLSLKSLIVKSKSLPTIIFDEIDSGVSGEVAGRMGRIMKSMSEHMQVINITHLPQIAGKGDQQFLVYKEDVDNSTHTRIRLLARDERINEIARMLSSDGLTEAARVNAMELMDDKSVNDLHHSDNSE
ncbi:MAG: DNA repair protein RecN [Bacteroidales bacterium]